MLKPDYKDGSIVNLMSSIGAAFGARLQYRPLRILPQKEFEESKNIVLIVIDGLGYNYLAQKGKGTFLYKHLKGRMTSVFPPTTASAITTFQTGTAPQQHAITGMLINFKEMGMVAAPLKFASRAGKFRLGKGGLKMQDLMAEKCFFDRIRAESFIVMDKEIVGSDYNMPLVGKAKVLCARTFNALLSQIRKASKSSNKRKYIYAYWPWFDQIAHKYGIASRNSEKHLKEMDERLGKFIKTSKNTTFIVTSDHGFVDFPKNKKILLESHPKLKECLSMPLSGDSRVKYCYVYASKARQFENYVKTRLKKQCCLFKSRDLVKMNCFGLFKPNPRLLDRIGDYTIITKNGFVMKDYVLTEEPKHHPGAHSGLSADELYVPLIVIKT